MLFSGEKQVLVARLGKCGVNQRAREDLVKRFPIKPMSVEEAILEVELLGHDFFVFANAETEKVNVLYRRKNGRYGLIEPELD